MNNLPIPYDWLKACLFFIAAILLTAYHLRARRSKKRLRLPVGFFIAFLIVQASLEVTKIFRLVSISDGLELAAAIALTLGIIRICTFIVFDYFIYRHKSIEFPTITRDIGLAVLYTFATLFILRYKANVNLASIITTSAVLTAVIGLSMQDTLGNLISGIVLQMEKPYQLGDWVNFEKYTGRVVGMSWKSTRILTRQHELILVPNNVISKGHIVNYSQPDPNHVATIELGCSYDNPPNHVREVILQTLREHPKVHHNPPNPPPEVRVLKFGESSIDYRILFFLSDFEREDKIKSEILNQLWYRFKRKGITIPYPTRTVHHVHPKMYDTASAEAEITFLKLRSVDLFKPVSDEQMKGLSGGVTIEDYSSGEDIVRQNDEGSSMYLLNSGECDVIISTEEKAEHVLTTLPAGSCFGEMSLLTGAPRTATVRANTDVSCLRIDKVIFERILRENPRIAEALSLILAERQADTAAQKDELGRKSAEPVQSNAAKILSKIRSFFNI